VIYFLSLEDFINRVSILASMSQVISSFDFDYIEGGLKLFWNSSGTMLGAGARSFRFAFWSFQRHYDFNSHKEKERKTAVKSRKGVPKLPMLESCKMNCLR
jgi:hypothetical protein